MVSRNVYVKESGEVKEAVDFRFPVLVFIFIALMATRPSLDIVFSELGISIGGVPLTPGSLVNIGIIGLAALIAQYYLLSDKIIASRILSCFAIWGPFLAVSAISLVRSPDLSNAIKTYIAYLTYFSVFLLSYVFDIRKNIRLKFDNIIIISAIIPICGSFYEIITQGTGHRLHSTFSHPNILAFYFVFMISYLFHCINSSREYTVIWRCIAWAVIVFSSLFLLFTQCRSAWIALFFFLLTYSIFLSPKMVIPLIMVPALAFALPQVRDRIMQVTVDRYSDVSTDYMMAMQRGEFLMIDPVVLNSGKWRSLLWSSSMEWVGDKPIFGYGMDSFKLYSSEFFPLSAGGGSAAHNVFVEQIFEGGIVGIVAYMWIFIAIWLAIFKNFSQRIRDKTTIIIMILSYFIISYSDNILHYLGFNWFFWFVVSSMLANCVQDKDARAA